MQMQPAGLGSTTAWKRTCECEGALVIRMHAATRATVSLREENCAVPCSRDYETIPCRRLSEMNLSRQASE